MRWIYLLLLIPGGVLMILALWVLQKCGVYKIEGHPDPPVGSDAGFYVEPEDIENFAEY